MLLSDSGAARLSQRLRIQHHASELGRWTEIQCRPQPALADHVEVIFDSEGQVSYRRDRLLPAGLSHLLINLGPPQYLVEGAARRVFEDLWFSGQHETYLETEAPQGTVILGVVFRPFGAYSILGEDQHALTGEVIRLDALLGDRVLQLREQLLNAGDPLVRLATVEGWLLERIRRGRATHPATRWATEQIAGSAGQIRIHDLARDSGYSRKYLIRLLRREVGLGPKALARIHRFHAFLDLLRREPLPEWSRLAVDCGYYDQSHLIREVRGFAGVTPRALAATPSPDGVTLALD